MSLFSQNCMTHSCHAARVSSLIRISSEKKHIKGGCSEIYGRIHPPRTARMDINMGNDLLWWGYRHINGSLQAKRYFDARDLEDARESDFVASVCPPFKANGRDEALKIIGERV